MVPGGAPRWGKGRAASFVALLSSLGTACGDGFPPTAPLPGPIVRPAAPGSQLANVPITFKFDSFPSATDLQLNGAAALQTGQLRITDNSAAVVGSAFYGQSVTLTNADSFSTYFRFVISNPVGGGNGGDGLMFVVQSNAATALGTGGGDLGYGGILQSFGVEFDTYRDPSQGDVDDQHLGTHSNGVMTSHLQQVASPTNWLGGARDVWVDYDGPTQQLAVRVNFSGSTRPASALLTQTVDLTSLLQGSEAFVGFTAATGSNTDNHFIQRWYFDGSNNPIDVVGNTYVQKPSRLELSAMPISGASVWALTVTARDVDGNSVAGIPIGLGTDLGSLSLTSGTTDASGQLQVTLTAGSVSGTAHLGASTPDAVGALLNVGLVANSSGATFFGITASAQGGGQVLPDGVIAVAQGASQTFVFTPDVAHHAKDVQVDAVSVGPVAQYTFTGVNAAHTLLAAFEEDAVPGHRRLDVGFSCNAAALEDASWPSLPLALLLLRSARPGKRRSDGRTGAAV